MNRRTIALVVAASTLVATLAACSNADTTTTGSAGTGVSAQPSGATASASATTPSGTASGTPAGTASGTTTGATAGTPAGIPVGTAPATPFAIGVRTLALSRGAGRPLKTTVWYPATGAVGQKPAPGRAAAPGPFPLVLFSHGLTAQPSDYAAVVTPWARAGFVVAAPAYPFTSTGVPTYRAADMVNQPADATAVITAVLALNGKAGDPLQGRIDAGRIAAAGHSAGGITTIGMLSANRDPRIKAAIVMSGRQIVAAPFTGPTTPVLFVHGKLDRTVTYADGLNAFRAVPWPKALITVTAGGHITTGTGLVVVVNTGTDFLRWSLYGDAAAKARLSADAGQGGVATLTDKL